MHKVPCPNTMTLTEFNQLDDTAANEIILRCCGSMRWAECMLTARPFNSVEAMVNVAAECWRNMSQPDFLEAFQCHPKIGELNPNDKTHALASEEQAAVATTEMHITESLAHYNNDYHKKFGFIFIVCASGKSAEEMLAILQSRITNTRTKEITNAAEEQRKITELRIHKLFE